MSDQASCSQEKSFPRTEALARFRQWFRECGQSLKIVGPSQCGKTFLAKQLSEQPDCVASHFCYDDSAQSRECATVIRSLGVQLMRRFPNLVLPRLATVTLLSDPSSSLEHYLRIPLGALPRPKKPLFLLIDDVDDDEVRLLVKEIQKCLPKWIRLVVTSRHEDSNADENRNYHIMRVEKAGGDFERFIASKLPYCSVSDIQNAAEGSWFYVEQLARAIEHGILPSDRSPPSTVDDLLDDVLSSMPNSVMHFLALIKAARLPPSRQQLLAVGQILFASDDVLRIEREISTILNVIANVSGPRITLPKIWRQRLGDDDLAAYHVAWCEHFKTKRRKSAQDVVELAYHFAHSKADKTLCVRTLRSIGAPLLKLQCAVVDDDTTRLLARAGAIIEKDEDLVYACALEDADLVETILSPSTSTMEACFGLLTASSRGNLAVCQAILAKCPAAANFACSGDWNALRGAACYGHLDVIEFLLSKGIAVDECGHGDRTALRAAAWSGQLGAVQLLLKSGAEVDRLDAENRTALMAAAFMDHSEVVQVLINFGADINARDASGATCLHLNLANGADDADHKATTSLLIQNGADVNINDTNGRVALHLAAYHGDSSLPVVMEKSSNVDVPDSQGRTPLMLAASMGKVWAVEHLVTFGGADVDGIDLHGRTALQLAAIHGHRQMVEYLCKLGSDEAHTDNDGAVALHYAAAHDDVDLANLLANEATIAAVDRYGQHPLMIAAEHGHVEVVEMLIGVGAPVNLAALDGRTAFSVAASAGHADVIMVLSKYITDWTQPDHDGVPLVHTLLIHKQVYLAETLLSLGTSASVQDQHGRTCEHVVANLDDVAAAKMLRRVCGCGFESRDDAGRTPLMTAVWSQNLRFAHFLLDTCSVDPNAVDDQGATALSIAAALGDRDIVQVLVKFGGETTARDAAGRTPFDVAILSGHDHIAAILTAPNGSADSSGFGSSVPNSPIDGGKRKTLSRRI